MPEYVADIVTLRDSDPVGPYIIDVTIEGETMRFRWESESAARDGLARLGEQFAGSPGLVGAEFAEVDAS